MSSAATTIHTNVKRAADGRAGSVSSTSLPREIALIAASFQFKEITGMLLLKPRRFAIKCNSCGSDAAYIDERKGTMGATIASMGVGDTIPTFSVEIFCPMCKRREVCSQRQYR